MVAYAGVTTGTAFCGVCGSSGNRREYTVLGDVVNLAARLMQRAQSDSVGRAAKLNAGITGGGAAAAGGVAGGGGGGAAA